MNDKEMEWNSKKRCISISPPNKIDTIVNSNKSNENFIFDNVFDENSTQSEVFKTVAQPIIAEVMKGYNGTVFAYGQTSSGKTHTMEGPDIESSELRGIIPRTVDEIFKEVNNSEDTLEFILKCSYIEIYMEKVRDLLDPDHSQANLQIREDPQRGVYVSGATEKCVTSPEELLQVLAEGKCNRAIAATGMNSGSSRSHSVFIITISQRNCQINSVKTGMLYLVDLAGSEMVKKTQAQGQTLEEAKTINKSLSSLGQVINALSDEKITHVPYRDSKLTRVLQNSLGGNSKTCLIINCSPSQYNSEETFSTLRFGSRAKKIKNNAIVNETRSVMELTALLLKAERTIEMQKGYIAVLESRSNKSNEPNDSHEQCDSNLSVNTASEDSEGVISSKALKKLHEKIVNLEEKLSEEEKKSMLKGEEISKMVLLLEQSEANNANLEASKAENQKKIELLETEVAKKIEAALKAESEARDYLAEMSKKDFQIAEHKLMYESLSKKYSIELYKMASDEEYFSLEGANQPPGTPLTPKTIAYGQRTPPKFVGEGEIEMENSISVYKSKIEELRKKNSDLATELKSSNVRIVELEKHKSSESAASSNKKVAKRLEQMVVVHKQLLVQYKTLEAESAMKDGKLELFSAHIQQLQENEESLRHAIMRLGESHSAEIEKLRKEMNDIRSKNTEFGPNRNVFRSSASIWGMNPINEREIKTIRGGRQSSGSEVIEQGNFLSRLFQPKFQSRSDSQNKLNPSSEASIISVKDLP